MDGIFDKRNKLNNLTGKEWLKLTKSFWVSEKCKEDRFAFQHPAPFLIKDIEKLISMFTKEGDIVLDPFNGVGTTLVACNNLKIKGIGIDLNTKYCYLANKILKELNVKNKPHIICHNLIEEILKIKEKIDYCVYFLHLVPLVSYSPNNNIFYLNQFRFLLFLNYCKQPM